MAADLNKLGCIIVDIRMRQDEVPDNRNTV